MISLMKVVNRCYVWSCQSSFVSPVLTRNVYALISSFSESCLELLIEYYWCYSIQSSRRTFFVGFWEESHYIFVSGTNWSTSGRWSQWAGRKCSLCCARCYFYSRFFFVPNFSMLFCDSLGSSKLKAMLWCLKISCIIFDFIRNSLY